MIKATITEEYAGLRVEATLIPIERGTGATVEYRVAVYSVAEGFATLIPDGAQFLPSVVTDNIKLKLWEQIKP